MKSLIYIFIAVLLYSFHTISAQNIGDLDGIYYQAVALDDETQEIVGVDIEAKPLYNREIGVRFTISKGLDGDIQWEETHVTTTDKYGLFTLTIGQGDVSSTAYARLLDIPWIDADQFLKVEISTKNDGNYKIVSNQKFMAVPYAFYTDDIADDAIRTEKILNEEILAEDIKEGAVETSEILNETILAEDINTDAVETSEILNETILAEDIKEGAVETSEILNETILAEDISTGAVESAEILNGTIVNEDIANTTIDLTTKVTNVLPVANGGTGLDGSAASDGQILIGDGITNDFKLGNISAGEGIEIANSPGGITITSPPISTQTSSDGSFEIPVGSNGSIGAGEAWYSPNSLKVSPPADKPFEMGDIFLASANVDLKGCILSVYLQSIDGTDGRANVQVILFNPQNKTVTLQTPVTFKFLLVK
ncbi:hypothetical protein E9993_17365 [Labilibacter sediminis]|nr:hypothetical protein E9993_17365 [Labilibacter sediminis]